MNVREHVAGGLVWSIAQAWGSRVISIVVFVVLARLVEPKAFGLVALASVFTGIINILLDGGFSEAIVQRRDLEREHLDTAFWIGIGLGVGLTAVSWLAAPFVAGWFQQPPLTPVLQWLSLTFVVGAIGITQRALLQRNLSFKQLATATVAASFIGGLAAVVAAWFGLGVWSLVVQILVTRAITTIVLWRLSDWRPRLHFSWQHGRQLFSFGMNVVGANLLLVLDRHALDLVIGAVLGPIALGYFALGNRIVRELTRGLTSVSKAISFPIFSRLQDDPNRMRDGLYTAIQFSSLIVVPVFVGLAFTAPYLVPVFCGTKWIPCIPILQVLAFVGLIRSVNVHGPWLKAAGRPGLHFWVMAAHAVGSLLMVSIVVYQGVVAVALGYLGLNLLLWPLWIYMVNRVTPLRYGHYCRQYLGPIAASIGMCITLTVIQHFLRVRLSLGAQLAVYVFAGLVSYPLFIWLTAPTLASEVIAFVRPRFAKSQT